MTKAFPPQRVVAVDDGVLKNFLMSRMPITNFSHSNGHGRRQPGLMPTGRQGNLIITSTNTVTDSELRAEIHRRNQETGKAVRTCTSKISRADSR